MWHIVTAFCSIPLSYFPCLDSCGWPISRSAIFELMFRAARVAVFLYWAFESCMWLCPGLSVYLFPMLVFWLWGTLLICGIYGRGVGDETLRPWLLFVIFYFTEIIWRWPHVHAKTCRDVTEDNINKHICQSLRTRVLSCGLITRAPGCIPYYKVILEYGTSYDIWDLSLKTGRHQCILL
jgi:ABC-type polysaccharide/polyol phosphate export permease